MGGGKHETDWLGWLARWDAQQAGYLPNREDRFNAIIDAVATGAGRRARVLDIGSGPGSLSRRLLDRLPDAEVVAIDDDPVLLQLGTNALAEYGSRIRWVDGDLRDAPWTGTLPAGQFDAVVSASALHRVPADGLPRLYGVLAALLRPGGLFLDGDHFAFGAGQRQIAVIATTIRTRQLLPRQSVLEDWPGWWSAIERESVLTSALAERGVRRRNPVPHPPVQSHEFHATALRAAGFSEVGTLWQRLTDMVLVAIR